MDQGEAAITITTFFQDYVRSVGKQKHIRIKEVKTSTRKNVGSLEICANSSEIIDEFVKEYTTTSYNDNVVTINNHPQRFDGADGVIDRYGIVFAPEELREYQDQGDESESESESDDSGRYMGGHEGNGGTRRKPKRRRRRRRRKKSMCSCTLFRLCLCLLITMVILFVLSKTL